MKNTIFSITALFTLLFSNQSFSQEEGSAYKAKLLFKGSYGINIPFSDLNINRETDYLIEHNDKVQMIPSLSALFFINKRWGVELNLKFITIKKNVNKQEPFAQFAYDQYNENYFVNADASSYSMHDPVTTFGIVYRFETDKMYLYPKLAIGNTPVDLISGVIELKEKNTNNAYLVSYSGGAYENVFTFLPSVSAGYKFSKRFWVDFSVNASYFKADLSYTKKFTDLYTKEFQTEDIIYKKNMFDTYISLGIIYIPARKK